MFILTSKFCSQWVVCPGAIYMYKIVKNMNNIRFQGDFLKLVPNDRSDKRFLLTSKFCPLGVVCPWPTAIYILLNHEKMCIKSEVEEIFLKLATNNQVMRLSCWHQKFGPVGCLPLPGVCTCIKSWKKCAKIRGQRYFWNMHCLDRSISIKILSPRVVSPCHGAMYTCMK